MRTVLERNQLPFIDQHERIHDFFLVDWHVWHFWLNISIIFTKIFTFARTVTTCWLRKGQFVHSTTNVRAAVPLCWRESNLVGSNVSAMFPRHLRGLYNNLKVPNVWVTGENVRKYTEFEGNQEQVLCCITVHSKQLSREDQHKLRFAIRLSKIRLSFVLFECLTQTQKYHCRETNLHICALSRFSTPFWRVGKHVLK